MPDEIQNETPTASEAPADATPPPETAEPATEAEPWRNPAEIKKFMQRVQRLEDENRELKTLLLGGKTRPTAAAPRAPAGGDAVPVRQLIAKQDSEIDLIRAERKLERALDGLEAPLSRQQRVRIEAWFERERPSSAQLTDWTTSALEAVGHDPKGKKPTPPPATNPVAPQPPPRKQSPGVPAPGSAAVLPEDPHQIPAEDWKALPKEERMRLYRERLARSGVHSDAFQKRKRVP